MKKQLVIVLAALMIVSSVACALVTNAQDTDIETYEYTVVTWDDRDYATGTDTDYATGTDTDYATGTDTDYATATDTDCGSFSFFNIFRCIFNVIKNFFSSIFSFLGI